MPPPGGNLSAIELGRMLTTKGPVKQELARRRVRGLADGVWLFDTLDAQYVWEHPYFPYFYIPEKDIRPTAPGVDWVTESEEDAFCSVKIVVRTPDDEKPIDAILFKDGPLRGLVKIYHHFIAWYVEDGKLLGPHPKDPYKRIDCHASSREIRIEVDGTVVARSTNNVFLYETGLRVRYYVQPTAILDQSMLLESNTSTACPYKGQASYYHLKVGNRVIDDAIWYYKYPTPESAPVQNRLCFYNEKVDVFVNGVKEEK